MHIFTIKGALATFRVENLNREGKAVLRSHIADNDIQVFRFQWTPFGLVYLRFSSLDGFFIVLAPNL